MGLSRKTHPRKDLTGLRFGMLTALEWVNTGHWKCRCDCGGYTTVDARRLLSGHTTSCGCKRYTTKNVTDMTGYEDDNFIVLYRDGNIGDTAAWRCFCKHCGREFTTKGSNIRFGYTQSCGCRNSKNEQIITSLLIEHGIDFETQYTFPDLTGVGGRPLRFDFAIFEDGKLKRLVEFHGKQHFGCPQGSWSKNYASLVENDIRKRAYCNQNGIELRMIPFDRPYTIRDILE